MPLSDRLRKALPVPDIERAEYLVADFESHLSESKIATVLDMGAGSGSMTAACLSIFPLAEATLVDVTDRLTLDEFLDRAQQERCMGLDWPAKEELAGKKFDLVLSMDVLEHVPDWRGALRQLFEYVAEGGYLYIQTPSRYPSPNWSSRGIYLNRFLGFFGRNNPATHVRHGLSCKEILDVCRPTFTPLVASESYCVNGRVPCAFKPRTHLLLVKN